MTTPDAAAEIARDIEAFGWRAAYVGTREHQSVTMRLAARVRSLATRAAEAERLLRRMDTAFAIALFRLDAAGDADGIDWDDDVDNEVATFLATAPNTEPAP